MATTGTQIITDRVRPAIEDVSGSTWTDPVLIAFLNDGQLFVRNAKPEVQLASPNALTVTFTDIVALGDPIYLPDRYREALVDYVCARALGMDGQDKRDLKRGQQYMEDFYRKASIPMGAAIGARMA